MFVAVVVVVVVVLNALFSCLYLCIALLHNICLSVVNYDHLRSKFGFL